MQLRALEVLIKGTASYDLFSVNAFSMRAHGMEPKAQCSGVAVPAFFSGGCEHQVSNSGLTLCHFENRAATKYDGASMPIPIRAYMKKSPLPQDRVSIHDMILDIIPMSTSQAMAPAITPLSSILDTLRLPEIQIHTVKKSGRTH
jgi:hypothetical protein